MAHVGESLASRWHHIWLDMVPHACYDGAMNLQPYVESVQRQLEVAAEAGGDEGWALAERLVASLEPAIRLTMQDVLGAAAEQITCELAPGSVELRVRGRDLEFVVTAPPTDVNAADGPVDAGGANGADQSPATRPQVSTLRVPQSAVGPDASNPAGPEDAEEGGMARINLRLPEQLKARVEQDAAAEGISVNSWLVRAAKAALVRPEPNRRSERWGTKGSQRYTGWAR